MADGQALSEGRHYDAFVTRSITELQRGLELDDTSAKAGVSSVVQAVLGGGDEVDPATKVLCARFALGGDDSAYLQSGLAVLWSTVAKSESGDDLTLAPEALYSPDAVGGIRRGLLRAMQAKHEATQENAEDNLRVLISALGGLIAVEPMSSLATELQGMVKPGAGDIDLVRLCEILTKLRHLTNGDGGDLAPSMLRRVDCMTRLVKAQQELALVEESRESAKRDREESVASLESAKAIEAKAIIMQAFAKKRQAEAEGKQSTAEAERDEARQKEKAANERAADALVAWLAAEKAQADAATNAAKLEALEREKERLDGELGAAKAKGSQDQARITELESGIAEAWKASRVTQRQADDDARKVRAAAERLQEEKDALQTQFDAVQSAYAKLSDAEQTEVQNAAMAIAKTQIDKNDRKWKETLLGTIFSFAFLGILGFLYVWKLLETQDNLILQFEGEENKLTCVRNVFGQWCKRDDVLPFDTPHDDPHVATALVRGLVGQRGPTEPMATARHQAPQDALLAYELPPTAPLAKCLPAVRHLLARLPAPTSHEVEAAIDALQTADKGSGEPNAKRARLALGAPTSIVHEALAEFKDNYAVISATPAATTDARGGVEMPHQVRWLPTGRRAGAMAHAAVLEHAIARCGQVLAMPSVAARPALAETIRNAAAALKLQQLAPLYELVEATAFEDDPHPTGTPAPMVTRPCAVVRGTLSLPVDAGVAPLPAQTQTGHVLNDQTALQNAMRDTASRTNAVRNALRRSGVASNVYVAPPAETLGFAQATTGATPEEEAQETYREAKRLITERLAKRTDAVNEANAARAKAKAKREEAEAESEKEVEPGLGVGLGKSEQTRQKEKEADDAEREAAEKEAVLEKDKALDEVRPYVENLFRSADARINEANSKVRQAQADAQEYGRKADKAADEKARRAFREAEQTLKKAQWIREDVLKETARRANEERARLEALMKANETVYTQDFALPTIQRLIDQALVTSAAIKASDRGSGCVDDPVGAFLREEHAAHGGGVDANDRREALWTEFQRHLSISQDRLWVFVRLLSGAIGGDVNEVITMADEASQQATKALQAQRVEVAKRVSDTQAKIVESVVSTMLKESKLAFDARADNLVVLDTEARKDLRDLASGASGRPFFEANVACRNMADKAEPMKLSALLSNLAAVGAQMQRSLDSTLAQPGLASASLVELSHPSNAYFVSMKADTSAAIRMAHERCNSELAARGVRRRLTLWELVEGGCTVLTTRFAEFAGHILVQNRASTGVSAMYVPHVAIETNAHQARVALAKLTNAAQVYAARVPPPSFGIAGALDDVRGARKSAMDHGAHIKEHDVGFGTPRNNVRTGYGHLYRAQSASGWWVR